MYQITVKVLAAGLEFDLATNDRKSARAMQLLAKENDKLIEVAVVQEVKPRAVKFKGID